MDTSSATPEQKMSNLLKLIGNVAECRGCKAVIVWVATKAKKPMPLNPDGVQHWSTCPAVAEFRRKKQQERVNGTRRN